MAVTQVPIGLKKQDEGDGNWDDALNSGFDDANSRLTLNGTGSPVGVVAGHWVGQYYIERVGAAPGKAGNLWVCTVATGVAGTTIWRKVAVHTVGTVLGRPKWIAFDGGDYYFPGPGRLSAAGFNTAAFGAGVEMTNTPTISLPPPAALDLAPVEYKFVVHATVLTNVDRTVCLRRSFNGGAWANISAGWSFKANAVGSFVFYDDPGGAWTSSEYRLGADAAAGLVKAQLVGHSISTAGNA